VSGFIDPSPDFGPSGKSDFSGFGGLRSDYIVMVEPQ
jgi:hypothetical protein